jgi:hypothetical protein
MPRGQPKGSSGLNNVEKKQTYKIAKRAVKATLKDKQHYHARTSDYEITTTSPLLVDFLNIPKGTTDADRSNDEILFKHLQINLDIQGSIDGTIKSGLAVDRVRVMLIRWREPDYVGGVANAPSALKLFGFNLPTGSNLFTAMVNHEENGRAFKILYDRKIELAGDITAMSSCDSPEKKRKFLSLKVSAKKYGLQKVKYDSINPGNNSHMNGVWLYVLTDNPGGTTQSGPTVSYDARLLFQE